MWGFPKVLHTPPLGVQRPCLSFPHYSLRSEAEAPLVPYVTTKFTSKFISKNCSYCRTQEQGEMIINLQSMIKVHITSLYI